MCDVLLVVMRHSPLLQSQGIEKNALVFIFPPNAFSRQTSELSWVIAVVSQTGISWAEQAHVGLVKSLLCYDISKTLIWVVIRCDVKASVQI